MSTAGATGKDGTTPANPVKVGRDREKESESVASRFGASHRPASGTGESPRNRARFANHSVEVEGISPLLLAKSKDVEDFDLDGGSRSTASHLHHHLHKMKRWTGRRSSLVGSPAVSDTRQHLETSRHGSVNGSGIRSADGDGDGDSVNNMSSITLVLDEVASWLREERARQQKRRGRRRQQRSQAQVESDSTSRRSSQDSQESQGLDLLEAILAKGKAYGSDMASGGHLNGSSSSLALRRLGSRVSRHLRKSSLLPQESQSEEEVFVPSCDVVLDNSRTLSYSGGNADTDVSQDPSAPRACKAAWAQFKHEIVRLSHTLKLKGWRHVSMSRSGDVCVKRLSGALTNAVYVVIPPENIDYGDDSGKQPRKTPVKLLLRIYGPQTEQLIDRESELNILRRLAKKHIGPRLLATFANGRFEEFLHAGTLTSQDLRDPDTSRQIAKRMRELHYGIELTESERDAGPFVWQNWDKCVEAAEKRASKLDALVTSSNPRYVCGTKWSTFRKVVDQYRSELEREYGGNDCINDQLVFAHNDAQYGNILRLEPPGESPLLLPANVHKQLVVIDFEYANANVPGLEFANHFTEWCYNYHDPERSFACNTARYPTLDEQMRFIRAYVAHRPSYAPAAPSTPRFTPLRRSGSISSIASDKSSYTLRDYSSSLVQSTESLRGPPSSTSYFSEYDVSSRQQQRERPDAEVSDELQRLLRETQLWRIANSAQWVVWGILQAEAGDSDDDQGQPKELVADSLDGQATHSAEDSKPQDSETESLDETDLTLASREDDDVDDEPPFDYLAYSRDRALFFWGDCLQLGLVTAEQLGAALADEVKTVPY